MAQFYNSLKTSYSVKQSITLSLTTNRKNPKSVDVFGTTLTQVQQGRDLGLVLCLNIHFSLR